MTSNDFSVDYHAESAAKLAQFEATLRNFAATIKERGFEGKLGIKLKNPQDYSMADVLSIAEKIQEKHRDADKVKSAMGRIRKCFRFAEDNHGQLKRLLKFVPNDTYGTVISGGFTIILGVSSALRTNDHNETLTYIRPWSERRISAPIYMRHSATYRCGCAKSRTLLKFTITPLTSSAEPTLFS